MWEPRVEAGSALQHCWAKAGRVMGVTRRSECRGAGEQQPRPFRQLCQEWGAAAMRELREGQREPTAPTRAWRRTARRRWLAWALPTIAAALAPGKGKRKPELSVSPVRVPAGRARRPRCWMGWCPPLTCRVDCVRKMDLQVRELRALRKGQECRVRRPGFGKREGVSRGTNSRLLPPLGAV